jgi:hypothetical protein
MDGGLGLFGIGLFLLSIILLFTRMAFGLAWTLLALSLVSMGLAFAETPRRREVALGLGVALIVAAAVSLAYAVAWWAVLATGLLGVAYLVLWAEFRFPFFQQVPEGGTSPRTRWTPRRK